MRLQERPNSIDDLYGVIMQFIVLNVASHVAELHEKVAAIVNKLYVFFKAFFKENNVIK